MLSQRKCKISCREPELLTRENSVEVVIVTRNSARHIGACVDSILAQRAFPIVVDNGSTDDTLQIVRTKCPSARIIAAGENLGYGKAVNLGFRETKSEFIVLSNPDVVYLDGSVQQLVQFLAKDPGIGVIAPQQMFPDRSWQRSYGDLPGIWPGIKDAIGITTLQNRVRSTFWPWRIDRTPKEVPYVDGAVLALRRKVFQDMGGFDEVFYFYSDESDLCARLKRAGWKVVFLPSAEVIHVRGADSAKVDRSDRFVRYMVNSQRVLTDRLLPPWKARLYFKLQFCHFARLRLMYQALKLISPRKNTIEYKLWMFGSFARIWKEVAMVSQSNESAPDCEKHNECKETLKDS